MNDDSPLTALASYFALLSLVAIGGAVAAIPDMHRVAVDTMHWMNDRQFTDSFAIAQLSPGPNVMIVALIGYHVAGLAGASVATAAMCGPTCIVAYFAAHTWNRFRTARWRIALQAALVPVSLGLIGASAFVLARAADKNLAAAAVTILLLVLAVTALFGAEVWTAFLDASHFTRTVVLEQGSTGFEKIQTVFSQVRFLGGPVALAYAMQALFFCGAAFLLVRLWRGATPFEDRGTALCLCTLLATPYSLDYDLMLLAPAIALLAAEGRAFGFPPYQMTLLAILWLMPVAVREIAQVTYFPLAVPAMMASFWLVCWRAYA